MMYKQKQNTSVLNRMYRAKIVQLLEDEESSATYEHDVRKWELYTLMNLGTDRQHYYIARWLIAMKVLMEEKLKETYDV